MGGDKPVRSRGWTAVLIVVVLEVAVLGAVGIYASVAGGPTFESRAWLHKALTPAPAPTPSSPSSQPVAGKPVELDPCELLTVTDINLTVGTRFLQSRASAGPAGDSGVWSDAWWATCHYEPVSGTEGLDLTVYTGPEIGGYEPEDSDRDVPGLGDEAWLIAESSDDSLTLQVRANAVLLSMTYYGTGTEMAEDRLTSFAREAVGRVPAKPEITPKRLGKICEAIPLEGAEEFLGAELVGGRESLTPQSATACSFAGDYGVELWLTAFPKSSVAEQRAFYRDEGERISGIGDEAYVYLDDDSEAIYFVRKGDLALEVICYPAAGEEIEGETRPTADEVTMLKSLLSEEDVVTG